MLFSSILVSSQGEGEEDHLTAQLYEAVVAYLEQLLAHQNDDFVRQSQNSLFVTGAYLCCFALKLARERDRYDWIDGAHLLQLVRRTAALFDDVGAGLTMKRATPQVYGRHLRIITRDNAGSSANAALTLSTADDFLQTFFSAQNHEWPALGGGGENAAR